MLAPISWRVPPRHYGPWELVVSMLTEGLVQRGVQVTLFATADSQTKAQLKAVCPRPYSEDTKLDAKVWECLHIAHAMEHASEFDILHNHFDFLPLSYSELVKTPMVTTIHGFSSEKIIPAYERYQHSGHYVSISDADRHPQLRYAATIHHGIPIQDFKPRTTSGGDYLLFFGRIDPEKGTHEAIEVAEAAGMELLIAGIVANEDYFAREIEPRLGNGIRYIGSVARKDRSALLAGARALLHLIDFDEPFGLSVVESMACGTPVIARNRGSMPEIIEDGKSGFLIQTTDEAIAAVRRLDEIDRADVRARVESRFDVSRMVDDYLTLYKELVGQGK
ncbi:MAG: glycosyltransferase family 4 protein [Candidatus Methylacidiphilales bacterium]|nr:glycosyltransferase family 4 protein [Candidatus Methylacidiphilales bacterium]